MKPTTLIFQNAAGEGPGILTHVLDRKGWEGKIVHLYRGEAIPSDWRSCELLVVLGGSMNVYEEERYPFLAEETMIIREALKDGMPVLGFCLGAQLMAKAGDAIVFRGPKREIGWYPVELTKDGADDPFLSSFPAEFVVFQWHGDTFDLPRGARLLIRAKEYPNQAMRIDSLSYGFQFHFEMTREMMGEWMASGREEMEEMEEQNLPERILKEADRYIPLVHSLAESFFDRYIDRIVSKKNAQW